MIDHVMFHLAEICNDAQSAKPMLHLLVYQSFTLRWFHYGILLIIRINMFETGHI